MTPPKSVLIGLILLLLMGLVTATKNPATCPVQKSIEDLDRSAVIHFEL
jgi:hypothetical protein